MFVIYRSKQ